MCAGASGGRSCREAIAIYPSALFILLLLSVDKFRLEILSPLSFYRLSQPPEVDNGSFRFHKSSIRAPSDGAQLNRKLSVRAATNAATRRAWSNRDGVGVDGCGHGRFDGPFHSRLRPHRSTVNEWNRPGRIRERAPKTPYYRAPKSVDDPLIGVAHMIADAVVLICGRLFWGVLVSPVLTSSFR